MKNLQALIKNLQRIILVAYFLISTVALASPQAENITQPEQSPPAQIPPAPPQINASPKVENSPPNKITTPSVPSKPTITKEECDKLKKKNKPLPSDCKTSDLSIVFQGGIKQKSEQQIKPVKQSKDTESETLHERIVHAKKKKVKTPKESRIQLWQVASMEPGLLPEEPSDFVTVGVQVGYSVMIQRASKIKEAFDPIIHVAAEVGYQLFPMFHLALVGEFEYMQGNAVASKEIVPSGYSYEDDNFLREPRDVGTFLSSYMGIGLRPTMRFNIHLRNIQLLAGIGLGWHFFHTSGFWRTKLPSEDRANNGKLSDQARWTGGDQAFYSFKTNDSGIYYVGEIAAMYRILEQRLGAGVFIKYTAMIHGAIEPDVIVEQSYNVERDWTGYATQENDYADTFIRSLSAFSLVTFGLTADFRF